jgi:triphosphatase
VLIERAPPGPLRDRLETARQTAYARVDEILASPGARALMLDLTQWTTSSAWLGRADTRGICDQPAREFASAALQRLGRKVKKHGRDLAGASDEDRHAVRKDAKKLRYAAGFFTALFNRKSERRRYKRFVEALEGLQDKLGALNDLVTAPDMLTGLGISEEPNAMALLFPGSKRKLLDAAEHAHDALVDAKRFWR